MHGWLIGVWHRQPKPCEWQRQPRIAHSFTRWTVEQLLPIQHWPDQALLRRNCSSASIHQGVLGAFSLWPERATYTVHAGDTSLRSTAAACRMSRVRCLPCLTELPLCHECISSTVPYWDTGALPKHTTVTLQLCNYQESVLESYYEQKINKVLKQFIWFL